MLRSGPSIILGALVMVAACDDGDDSDSDPDLQDSGRIDGAAVPPGSDATPDAAAPADAEADARARDAGRDAQTPDAAPDATTADAATDAAGDPPLPDLLLRADQLSADVWLDEREFTEQSCAVVEGCITTPGRRLLLRFGVTTANIGTADLRMGRPEDNLDLFEWSECHAHHHFTAYARYALLDLAGNVLERGHKQAFCLLDSGRYLADDPTVRERARYTCEFQGISRGWEDTYGSGLDCQWIDVTDLEPGAYRLRVEINPDHVLRELDYTNNDAEIEVTVPPYDLGAPCDGVLQREGLKRACGWTRVEVGQCQQGNIVQLGCTGAAGCGGLGSCEGDPMLRVCEGDDGQCLRSNALAESNNACETDCPYVAFDCPVSGTYTVWTAPHLDAEAYTCDLARTEGPPPPVSDPCQGDARGSRGLDRDCGWTVTAEDAECLPGFEYDIGCNPAACPREEGERCDGDPMLRICEGARHCTAAQALAFNDDSCNNTCPGTTFTCPPSGRYTVLTAPYQDGRRAECRPGVVRRL